MAVNTMFCANRSHQHIVYISKPVLGLDCDLLGCSTLGCDLSLGLLVVCFIGRYCTVCLKSIQLPLQPKPADMMLVVAIS